MPIITAQFQKGENKNNFVNLTGHFEMQYTTGACLRKQKSQI